MPPFRTTFDALFHPMSPFEMYYALPPVKKKAELAVGGAIGLGYVAEIFPYAVKNFPPPVLLGFAGFALGALLLLIINVRRARFPRDLEMALLTIAVPAIFAAALWVLTPELLHSAPFMRLLAEPFLCGMAVRFWLALRGLPGNAQAVAHKATAVALRDMTPAAASPGLTPITREDQASDYSPSPSPAAPV